MLENNIESLSKQNSKSRQDELISHIRQYITKMAKTLNLEVSFAPGRRKDDLIVIKLNGEHQLKYVVANCLVEVYPEIDIDVPKKSQTNGSFLLIVTQKPS